MKTFNAQGSALGAIKILKMSNTQFLQKCFETHLFMNDRVTIVCLEENMVVKTE